MVTIHSVDFELMKVVVQFIIDGLIFIFPPNSKLTLNNDCTAVLAEHPTAFQSLLALLNKHLDRNDLVVRVGFVLGNLTARNDDCRYCLFNTEGAMETLQGSIRRYMAKDLRVSTV